MRQVIASAPTSNSRLAEGYSVQDNFVGLLDVASALEKDEPESKQAFEYNLEALMGLSRFDDALALADARLKLLDNDSDAYAAKMEIEANRGDFAAAHAWGEKQLALGQENAEILNGLGMGRALHRQSDRRRRGDGGEGDAIAEGRT
jgi:tetratricopeptide (TPR) repeat protein